MDLNQSKLTKTEWESIEVPVSMDEKEVIQLVKNGFTETNISYNSNKTLLSFMKLEFSKSIECYVYDTYFAENVKKIVVNYGLPQFNPVEIGKSGKNIKKIDKMRIDTNTISQMQDFKDDIYEYVLLGIIEKFLKHNARSNERSVYYYYTLTQIVSADVIHPNNGIISFTNTIIQMFNKDISLLKLITSCDKYIEKNPYLLQYDNTKLYTHQKRLFEIFQKDSILPKLVLYTAPTATGKTMSPIGLSEKYRVIFVCAARHVGLALSKLCVSAGKKIAFAFGCSCSEDIRLHYYAAKEYTKDWRSGNIRKVDNTIGDNVEIMICDIHSYEYAMLYMMAFNDKTNIVTFWDEPTIFMDYDEHSNHELVHNVWYKNLIPNVILSSATLPKCREIPSVIDDFKCRFENAVVYTIESNDCKKTIPLLNEFGVVSMPHSLCTSRDDLQEIIEHCNENKTLYRYVDLCEIGRFIKFVVNENMFNYDFIRVDEYFDSDVKNLNMNSVKNYYFELLQQLREDDVVKMNHYFTKNEEVRLGTSKKRTNGVFISTTDAYSLSDGPTIYMTKEPIIIGKFCLQQLKIPSEICDNIFNAIEYNQKISHKLDKLHKDIEDKMLKEEGKENRIDRGILPKDVVDMQRQISALQNMLKSVELESKYVPNTRQHIERYVSDDLLTLINEGSIRPFTTSIDNVTIQTIMELHGVDTLWKLLLIMGIGVFDESQTNVRYTEIVKSLAQQQMLYLIIATDDYIYGTNYQFCHGYVGKDLENMTQEKIIQALGRVGRNKVQKYYSARFRNAEQLHRLFHKEECKMEVINMNKLFTSDKV